MNLNNQVAVVTGASRGLGQAIAVELAKAGCRLALVARDAEQLQALAQSLKDSYDCEVRCYSADLASTHVVTQTCAQILADFGGADILINNAGVGYYKPFLDHSSAQIDAIIDLNVKGAIHMSYGLLGQMLAKRHGHIVNIASDLSHRPLANMATYTASKFALRGFSLSLMHEVKTQGVKVSLVNPGIINTYFGEGQPDDRPATEAMPPESVAIATVQLLQQPKALQIDELTLHPIEQGY